MTLSEQIAKTATSRTEQEHARVEDFVITANITLIAAYVVILTVSDNLVGLPAGLSAGSIVFLVMSLLACLWHKYRHPLRRHAWDTRKSELAYRAADNIVDFMDTFVKTNPNIMNALAQADKTKRKEDVPEYVKVRDIIATQIRQTGAESRVEYRKIFDGPLKERNAKFLAVADRACRKVRYASFGAGVLLFLASVVILLSARVV